MTPRGKARQQAPVTTAQRLRTVIKSCRDIMRKDKGLNGDLDRLPMLTWIMFLKFLDDLEQLRTDEAVLEGKRFRAVIDPPYRWRDWNPTNSAGVSDGLHNAMTGDALTAFINQDEAIRPDGARGPGLFAYLKGLGGSGASADRRDVVASVFRGTVNRVQSGYILRDVLNKVNEIHFASSEETHTLSHFYESMLKEMRDAAGDSGEFYTPRPLVKMIVSATDPKLGEVVLDPAAGTGGFLVESFEHMSSECKTVEDFDRLQHETLFGIEAKPLPYLLCEMNLLLHGIETPQIDPLNALRFRMSEIGDRDRVDVIVTNPPFGGEEERGIQGNFPDDRRTAETALLFLQLIMRKLRRPGHGSDVGGRAGVVVPNGTLSGDGVAARIKQDLLEGFNLHTIVRLPDGVFSPYTPIPTNVLFFDRSGPTKEIWYYEHPLPDGRRSYTKTRPLEFGEFIPMLEWWSRRRATEAAWCVSVDTIRESGWNLDVRNPNRPSSLADTPPTDLINSAIETNERVTESLRDVGAQLENPGASVSVQGSRGSEGWERIRLGRALTIASDPYVVQPEGSYPNIGILSFGRGVFGKPPINGSDTSAKQLFRIRGGQFIYSRLFAFEGAYADVPEQYDGYYVSNEFPVFDVDPNITTARFLAVYFRASLSDRLASASRGLGNRRQRVHPESLLDLEIWMPPPPLQKVIVDQTDRLAESKKLLNDSAGIVSALELSMLNQYFAGHD
jgi:type I restriction enzyme M protein